MIVKGLSCPLKKDFNNCLLTQQADATHGPLLGGLLNVDPGHHVVQVGGHWGLVLPLIQSLIV